MAESAVVPFRQQVFDLDAEAAVLSAVFLANAHIDEIRDMLPEEAFYADANRRVYRAMLNLWERKHPVDIVTVATELRALGEGDDDRKLTTPNYAAKDWLHIIGGTPYLVQLSDAVPHVANIVHYARIVRERWRLRVAREHAQRVAAHIAAAPISNEEVQPLIEATAELFSDLAYQSKDTHLIQLAEPLVATYTALVEMAKRGDEITGVPTGFKSLDKAMSGLHKQDFTVVAGRPGTGKTAFAIQIAKDTAMKGKLGAGIFSLEMPATQLVTRLLSSHSRIPLQTFRNPNQIGKHWDKIADTMAAIGKIPLFIDETAGITMAEIKARIRKLKADMKAGRTETEATELGLVVVDYMQLMRPPTGGRQQNREQEVAHTSREMKLLAKEEDVIVLGLSQLNRSLETRTKKDRRPQLSDLRESGAIEQDADNILFIYRESLYEDDPDLEATAEIIVGKQRNGPTGIHKVAFTAECVRFDPLERSEFDEYDGFEDAG